MKRSLIPLLFLFLVMAAFFSCAEVPEEKAFFRTDSRVLAHRGDSAFFPENTMPAFLSAAGLGVDVLETDLRITKDGVVVIGHDAKVDRVSDGTGYYRDQTWGELQVLDAGFRFSIDGGKTYPFRNRGLGIVRFEDLLTALPEQKFNLDLKEKDPRLPKAFAEIVRRHGAEERICVGSFHSENLEAIQELIPEMARTVTPKAITWFVVLHKVGLGFLIPRGYGDVLALPEFTGWAEEEPGTRILSERFVRRLQKKGYKVQVWTVNEEAEMNRFLDWGADGIFTDDPRLMMKVLESRRG